MKVQTTIKIDEGHSIEFGRSSWDENESSVRNRYQTASGGFSPRSSSELPIRDVLLLAEACIAQNIFSAEQLHTLVQQAQHAINTNNK